LINADQFVVGLPHVGAGAGGEVSVDVNVPGAVQFDVIGQISPIHGLACARRDKTLGNTKKMDGTGRDGTDPVSARSVSDEQP